MGKFILVPAQPSSSSACWRPSSLRSAHRHSFLLPPPPRAAFLPPARMSDVGISPRRIAAGASESQSHRATSARAFSTIFSAVVRLQEWMHEPSNIISMTEQDRQISEIIAEERSRLRNFIRKRVPNEADAEICRKSSSKSSRLIASAWSAWMFRVARIALDLFAAWAVRTIRLLSPARETAPRDVLPSPDAGPAESMRDPFCSTSSRTPSTNCPRTSATFSSRMRSKATASRRSPLAPASRQHAALAQALRRDSFAPPLQAVSTNFENRGGTEMRSRSIFAY